MAEKKQRIKTEKTDLAQKAYQGIRQMLFYNEILPGQKIKYQDLADKIGVSITPLIQRCMPCPEPYLSDRLSKTSA